MVSLTFVSRTDAYDIKTPANAGLDEEIKIYSIIIQNLRRK